MRLGMMTWLMALLRWRSAAAAMVILCVPLVASGQTAVDLQHDGLDRLQVVQWPQHEERYVYDSAGNLRQRVRIKRNTPGQPDNGHTYALITCGTWSTCRAQARALGGELVTVRSQADNDWLMATFAPQAQNSQWPFWIGMNDLEQEGVWRWSSGEPLVFQNWAPGEPNDHLGVEDVAHVMADQQGRWNDGPDNTGWGIGQAVVEFTHARWDARADFSPAPPVGPWRYARRMTDGTLRAMDKYTASCPSLPAGIACWTDSLDDTTLPMVAIDTLGTPHRETTVMVPTDALILHPGEQHDSAIVQFVVPQSGRYGVTASFEGIDVSPIETLVRIRVGEGTVLEAPLSAYRQAKGISRSWMLEAGDVISFEVLEGGGSYHFDSTALRVQITPMD